MRTKITQPNPHDHTRYAFAWEHVPSNSRAHLDYGCHDGDFLNTLTSKHIGSLTGVDVAREAVEAGKKVHPDLDIQKIEQADVLPFDDGAFSSATILDVLEHIYEQKQLLDELHRVIAPGGTLIVTTPGKHIFSWLDVGNFKFMFPKLHKWHYLRKHTQAEYDHRYANNPDGLIGDVSAKKRWHEHFKPKYMASLLKQSGFEAVLFDGAGFWMRPVGIAHMTSQVLGISPKLFERLGNWDMKKYSSANVYCLARRVK